MQVHGVIVVTETAALVVAAGCRSIPWTFVRMTEEKLGEKM